MAGAGYNNKFCQTVQMHDDVSEAETQVINLYPELNYEIFEGFGGAVTEAAGYVYSLMNEEQKNRWLRPIFLKMK